MAAILARRHDNGADFWSTPDGRIHVGSPFSTIAALGMLHELGVPGTTKPCRAASRCSSTPPAIHQALAA